MTTFLHVEQVDHFLLDFLARDAGAGGIHDIVSARSRDFPTMILPTKYLSRERSLLGVGAEILKNLDEPRFLSDLWDRVRREWSAHADRPPISFDWFVLALSLLYALAAIGYDDRKIYKEQ